MDVAGAWCLLLLLLLSLMVLAHPAPLAAAAVAGSAGQVRQPTSDSASQPGVLQQPAEAASPAEVRMLAMSHVASLVIRSLYCKLETDRPCELPDVKLAPLRDWAVAHSGWERVLLSTSMYELSRRFWQQHDYERSVMAVEQAVILKLFPLPSQPEQQARWQAALVRPGDAFKRPKLELADALILKAHGMYELGRRDGRVELLHQALKALRLAAALMHISVDLVPEVVQHLETLATHVGVTAAATLERMPLLELQELISQHTVACAACGAHSKPDHVRHLAAHLALPVEPAGGGTGDGVQVIQRPFVVGAYGRLPHEGEQQRMQWLFAQLVDAMPGSLLSEAGVPCALRRAQQPSDPGEAAVCDSYLPAWVLAPERDTDTQQHQEQHQEQQEAGDQAEPPSSHGTGEAAPAGVCMGQEVPVVPPPQGSCQVEYGSRARVAQQQPAAPVALHACAAAAAEVGEWSAENAALPPGLDDLLVGGHSGAEAAAAEAPPSDAAQAPLGPLPGMESLFDRWLSKGLSADTKQLVASMEVLSGLGPDAASADMASGEVQRQGADKLGWSSPTAAAADEGTVAYGEAFQRCLVMADVNPSWCLDLLDHMEALKYLTPDSPLAVVGPGWRAWAAALAQQADPVARHAALELGVGEEVPKLAALPPLLRSQVPPPPPKDHCCPTFRRRLGDPHPSAADLPGAYDSLLHPAALPTSPDGMPLPPAFHLADADSDDGDEAGGMDDTVRQAVDRQLKEHIDRLSQQQGQDHDDPIVVLTLSGATLAVMLAVSFAKHRKRVARFIAGHRQMLHLPASGGGGATVATGLGGLFGATTISGVHVSSVAVAAALMHQGGGAGAMAAGFGGGGGGAGRAAGAQQRRAIAAALRDAMLGADVARLEEAVLAADDAGLEQGMLLRAKQLLQQRRRQLAPPPAPQPAHPQQQQTQRSRRRSGRHGSGAGKGGAATAVAAPPSLSPLPPHLLAGQMTRCSSARGSTTSSVLGGGDELESLPEADTVADLAHSALDAVLPATSLPPPQQQQASGALIWGVIFALVRSCSAGRAGSSSGGSAAAAGPQRQACLQQLKQPMPASAADSHSGGVDSFASSLTADSTHASLQEVDAVSMLASSMPMSATPSASSSSAGHCATHAVQVQRREGAPQQGSGCGAVAAGRAAARLSDVDACACKPTPLADPPDSASATHCARRRPAAGAATTPPPSQPAPQLLAQPVPAAAPVGSRQESFMSLCNSTFAADLERLDRLALGEGDDEEDDGWQQRVSRPNRRNRATPLTAPAQQAGTGCGGKPQLEFGNLSGLVATATPPPQQAGKVFAAAANRSANSGMQGSFASVAARGGKSAHSGKAARDGKAVAALSTAGATSGASDGAASGSGMGSAPISSGGASPAETAAHRRPQSRSSGWLDWISHTMLSSSPTSASATDSGGPYAAAASPAGKQAWGAGGGKPGVAASGKAGRQPASVGAPGRAAGDTSLLQQASPIRIGGATAAAGRNAPATATAEATLSYHKCTSPWASLQTHAPPPPPAAASSLSLPGGSPTHCGIMGTLSSLIGYGTATSPSMVAVSHSRQQQDSQSQGAPQGCSGAGTGSTAAAAVTTALSYSSVTASSCAHSSTGSPLPSSAASTAAYEPILATSSCHGTHNVGSAAALAPTFSSPQALPLFASASLAADTAGHAVAVPGGRVPHAPYMDDAQDTAVVHNHSSLIDMLPNSILDMSPHAPQPLQPSLWGNMTVAATSSSSRPLNPSAPSFRSVRTAAVDAAVTAQQQQQPLVSIAPLATSLAAHNLTGLHQAPLNAQAVAAAVASQRRRADPFAMPLSARASTPLAPDALPTIAALAAPASTTSTAAVPPQLARGALLGGGGSGGVPANLAGMGSGSGGLLGALYLAAPYTPQSSSISSPSGTTHHAPHLHSSLDSLHGPQQPLASGGEALLAVPPSVHFSSPTASLYHAAAATPPTGASTPLHTSLGGGGGLAASSTLAGGLLGSGSAAAAAASSALQNFTMFAGRSVWSPSAVVAGADGVSLGGWGAAAAAAVGGGGSAAAAAAGGGDLGALVSGVWGPAAMQLPFRTVAMAAGGGGPLGSQTHLAQGRHGGMVGMGSVGGAAGGLLATCSGDASHEDLHEPDELCANDLAQDIMRAVVD